MNLDKIYIDEAIRIRKSYIKSINNILNEEKLLLKKKEEIDKIYKNITNIIDSELHDVTKRLKLNEQLINTEKIINNIQKRIRPHYNNIDQLKKDANNLYTSIIEKYPNISKDEIEKEISPYLQF